MMQPITAELYSLSQVQICGVLPSGRWTSKELTLVKAVEGEVYLGFCIRIVPILSYPTTMSLWDAMLQENPLSVMLLRTSVVFLFVVSLAVPRTGLVSLAICGVTGCRYWKQRPANQATQLHHLRSLQTLVLPSMLVFSFSMWSWPRLRQLNERMNDMSAEFANMLAETLDGGAWFFDPQWLFDSLKLVWFVASTAGPDETSHQWETVGCCLGFLTCILCFVFDRLTSCIPRSLLCSWTYWVRMVRVLQALCLLHWWGDADASRPDFTQRLQDKTTRHTV